MLALVSPQTTHTHTHTHTPKGIWVLNLSGHTVSACMQVTLRWRCMDKETWQEAPMERVSPGQPLYSASITADLRCEPWDGTPPAALLQVA